MSFISVLSICLSVCLVVSVCWSVYSVHLSALVVESPVCSSVYIHGCLYICPSIYPSHMFPVNNETPVTVTLNISSCLFVCRCTWLPVCLFLCLSFPYVYLDIENTSFSDVKYLFMLFRLSIYLFLCLSSRYVYFYNQDIRYSSLK